VEKLAPESKHCIVSEQIAQVDSKDMGFEIWERLHVRISAAQNDPKVHAIIITHGTDTMEETAYFLHRTVQAKKPVILTGAMRPADSEDSDGPQNLAFAVQQAEQLSAGVWVAFAGKLFSGGNVQKVHPTRLDAFDVIDGGFASPNPPIAFHPPIQHWPRVDVVMSHAGASGDMIGALVAQKVDGIVVVGTGNCTVHHALEAALDKAREAGIATRLCSRCSRGGRELSPVQTRIDLMLGLLAK
jgi:L-asparaginase